MSGIAFVRQPGAIPAEWEPTASVGGRLLGYLTLAALVLCPVAFATSLVLRMLWSVRRPPAWLLVLIGAAASGFVAFQWRRAGLDWRGGLAAYWFAHRQALVLAAQTALSRQFNRPVPELPPDAWRLYLATVAPTAIPAGVALAALATARSSLGSRFPGSSAAPAGAGTESGIGNAARERHGSAVVDVAVGDEPAARRWVVGNLVPEGYVTLLYGDGGLGKSTVALHLAACVVTGTPFVGQPVDQGPVLYVDGELDRDEFRRRAYAVARGLGMSRPPKGLYYYRLPGPLTDLAVQWQVTRRLNSCGPRWQFWRSRRPALVVFDSLTIAGGLGQSANDEAVAEIFGAMERWRCATVAIDHVTKPAPNADPRTARPFSSTFKWNHCRSAIVLVPAAKDAQAQGATLELFHRKSNFGALCPPLYLAVEREGATEPPRLGYRPVVVATSPEPAAAEEQVPVPSLTATDRLWLTLEGYGAEGATVEELAQATGRALATVRNTLTVLRKEARAVAVDGGRWRAVRAA